MAEQLQKTLNDNALRDVITQPPMSAEGDVIDMKEKRDIKIGIKSDKELFDELKELTGRIDDGWLPDKPVERLYFDDLP
jgi:hypothetical protein